LKKYLYFFLKEWKKNNADEFNEAASRGGITQGNINKEKNKGIFAQTKEQWSINASKNSKVFWETSSKEKLKNRADKCSDSMKKCVEEKGWWNPHQYITPELQKEMTLKQIQTKLNQREERIKELYDAIETNDWFNIEYATQILSTISKKGASQSTTRRMIHGWEEASKYYECRKTECNEIGKKYIQWKKII